nr:MAG TPA: hypothetical protein [Caudoviricetes sp.]
MVPVNDIYEEAAQGYGGHCCQYLRARPRRTGPEDSPSRLGIFVRPPVGDRSRSRFVSH